MNGAIATGSVLTLASGWPGAVVVLFVFAVVAIGGLAIWWERTQRAERRRRYLELAARLGVRYEESPGIRLDQEFPAFACFAQGHSRRLNHLLRGEVRSPDGHDHDLLAGEWQYAITVSNGKTTTTVIYRFGFVILGLRIGRCPAVAIRRENLMDKLAGALGWDDIDFESVEFSKKFHVKSADKRFAYDLLDPQMIELFLIADSIPQVDLGGEHACLHFSRGTVLEPPMLDLLIQWGTHLVDRIPRVVRAGLAEGRYGGIS